MTLAVHVCSRCSLVTNTIAGVGCECSKAVAVNELACAGSPSGYWITAVNTVFLAN